MEITRIGIDLAKSVLALSAADRRGRVVLRKQFRRAQVLGFMRSLGRCVVGLEACGGAHHWARALSALGHEVKLMSAALVASYRKGNKHDRNDADAVLEAVSRPTMRFVAVKTVAQQDLLALHRVRARLLKQRIALSNQLRALLHERGVTAVRGAAGLRTAVRAALAEERNELSAELRQLIAELREEMGQLELRLKTFDQRLERAARQDERCARLREVPGVGPLTASALVATVGDAREFKSGRELSAYLGLVPRQHSSGGKTVLLGISKRGDRYLRMLLIHGARALLHAKRWASVHPRARWAARLRAARGPNVAAVALANHNARLLWALLRRGNRYQARRAVFRPGPPAAGERARNEKPLALKPA